MELTLSQKKAVIEALLFAAGGSVSLDDLSCAVSLSPIELAGVLEDMHLKYASEESGLQLKYLGESVQLATKAEYGEILSDILAPVKTKTLSQSVLETLAIIAYRQPVTRADIEAIRGVRSEYAIDVLESLNLINEVGRKDTIGRPALFGTTEEFLRKFGLETLQQLPELAEFHDWSDTVSEERYE